MMKFTWQKIGCVLILAMVVAGLAAIISLSGCTADQTQQVRDTAQSIGETADSIGNTIPGTKPYTTIVSGIAAFVVLAGGWWSEWQEKRRLQRAIKTVDPIIDALPDARKMELSKIQGPKVAAATKRAKLA